MYKDLLRNRRLVLIAAIVLLLALLFKRIVAVAALVMASFGVSYVVNNLKIRQLGLELVTLTAVISGHLYGPTIGFIVALVLIVYHMLIGGFIGMYLLWVIPSYCMVGIVAGLFPGAEITTLGTILTISLNAVYLGFTAMFTPGAIGNFLMYSATNVMFNIFLFSTVAKLLIQVL